MPKTLVSLKAVVLITLITMIAACQPRVDTVTSVTTSSQPQTTSSPTSLADVQAALGVEVPRIQHLPVGYGPRTTRLVDSRTAFFEFSALGKPEIVLRVDWDPAGRPVYKIDPQEPTMELDGITAQLSEAAGMYRLSWNLKSGADIPGLFGIMLTLSEELPMSEVKAIGESIGFINLKQVSVAPPVQSVLSDSQNVSSAVVLRDVKVVAGISGKLYSPPPYRSSPTVVAGESIVVVSGHVTNEHDRNTEISLYAEGYDEMGKQIAWTLDTGHATGQIAFHLDRGKTTSFVLHLNMAESLETIRIYAGSYAIIPP